jgi:hypothetical protein
VIYNRCWNGPHSACKLASHCRNELCNTFRSSSTAIEAIIRVPVLSVLTIFEVSKTSIVSAIKHPALLSRCNAEIVSPRTQSKTESRQVYLNYLYKISNLWCYRNSVLTYVVGGIEIVNLSTILVLWLYWFYKFNCHNSVCSILALAITLLLCFEPKFTN